MSGHCRCRKGSGVAVMKLIERRGYLEKLKSAIGTPDIKVITGVRRSGKSKLLEALAAYVRDQVPDSCVIHVNFNLLEFEALQEYHALYRYINDRCEPGKANFVFIDEVQLCQGFEKAVNSLHASEKFDIFLTGSNAFLLSSDLATLFTGRTFEIQVFPFSFAEFNQYYGTTDLQKALDRYIVQGGLAGSYVYQEREARYDYIADVFDTLILRDIKQKYRVRYPVTLENISEFLMDNVGNLASGRSIAKALLAGQDKAAPNTVRNYLQYLCNAFAFYKVRRYDIRGKKYLAASEKYYLSDPAFRYAKLGTKNLDTGRILENIVALELLRRGYEIYAGVLYKTEIDFVALKRDEKLYIQVAGDISAEETLQREVRPLLAIRDAYPKILLARTRQGPGSYEGIQILDLAEWLAQS